MANFYALPANVAEHALWFIFHVFRSGINQKSRNRWLEEQFSTIFRNSFARYASKNTLDSWSKMDKSTSCCRLKSPRVRT